MSHQYKLSKELRARLDALREELQGIEVTVESLAEATRQENEDHSEALAEASEKYREGERGLAVGEWIQSFDVLADAFDDLSSELEIVGEYLDNLTDRPEG